MQRKWFATDTISIHALRAEGDGTLPLRCRADSPDFYPRPPCGGRRWVSRTPTPTRKFLSTPSVRRATISGNNANYADRISIHALRAEGDGASVAHAFERGISIHALRAEGDHPGHHAADDLPDFYPRPPCGGRHGAWLPDHGDARFLSTPSVRRATNFFVGIGNQYTISIHALRAEGDIFGGVV